MTIDPIPSPKPRTVWAVATSRQVYERIRDLAIARQTSNAKVVAEAIDLLQKIDLFQNHDEARFSVSEWEIEAILEKLYALKANTPRKETRDNL